MNGLIRLAWIVGAVALFVSSIASAITTFQLSGVAQTAQWGVTLGGLALANISLQYAKGGRDK